jgi:hypothetical protein
LLHASLPWLEDSMVWFVAFCGLSGVVCCMACVCVCSLLLCVHCMHARTAMVGNTATNYQSSHAGSFLCHGCNT